MAFGVTLAASTFIAMINPANAAVIDMAYYPTSVAAYEVTKKESESMTLRKEAVDTHKNSHSKNDEQQKYNRSKYNSVKQTVEMNRTLKKGEDRRIGSGSYSS